MQPFYENVNIHNVKFFDKTFTILKNLIQTSSIISIKIYNNDVVFIEKICIKEEVDDKLIININLNETDLNVINHENNLKYNITDGEYVYITGNFTLSLSPSIQPFLYEQINTIHF